jgi:hypothetical protein
LELPVVVGAACPVVDAIASVDVTVDGISAADEVGSDDAGMDDAGMDDAGMDDAASEEE